MSTKTRPLTEQELEIMKVVWELESATVRDVYEALRRQREIAYTTVMTMMNILEVKGHLRKRLEGRAYVYEPVLARGQVISGMVEEFIDRVFNGAAGTLVLGLVKERKLSAEDLEEISRLIKEAE